MIKQLTDRNLGQYCVFPFSVKSEKEIPNVLGLLQRNYGQEQDCTLTSLTALILHYTKTSGVQDIYNEVERIATKLGYKGNIGTNPLVIRCLMQSLLKRYQIKKICYSGYLKSIGFTIDLIKKLINKDVPIILNLSNDGRKYYQNHSVLVIGYKEIALTKGKTMFFLKVKDNWNKETSYIDYSKLSMISSINYAI